MNIYSFRYRSSAVEGLLSAKYEARNLSSALKLFWSESKEFSCPVERLSRAYEVINSEGKCSFRFLKDNVKVYPDEN